MFLISGQFRSEVCSYASRRFPNISYVGSTGDLEVTCFNCRTVVRALLTSTLAHRGLQVLVRWHRVSTGLKVFSTSRKQIFCVLVCVCARGRDKERLVYLAPFSLMAKTTTLLVCNVWVKRNHGNVVCIGRLKQKVTFSCLQSRLDCCKVSPLRIV